MIIYKSQFLNYLQNEKRFSAHTVSAYNTDLIQFFNFLSTYTEINHYIIKSWLVTLKESKLSNKTIHRKISVLKSYFKYLQRNNYIQHNPMTKISSPKLAKNIPSFLTEIEMGNLVGTESEKKTYNDFLHPIIIEFLYQTGIRKSELINLQCQHVDMDNKTIKVIGKGNKERIIPLKNEFIDTIKQYILQREQLTTIIDSAFFIVSEKGKKLNPRSVYQIVKNQLANFTTLQKKSPHVLRHTFATHLLNNGAEIDAVKELLGHSSLAATQLYTHNTIDKLKLAYKKAHPKA